MSEERLEENVRVRMEPELLDRLRLLADAEHRPVSGLIRSILWREVSTHAVKGKGKR